MDKAKDLTLIAFTLGVTARQERQFISVQAASNYFYEVVSSGLLYQYKDIIDEALILSYADYLASIALLGYIVPYICSYDEDFIKKIMAFILARKPRDVINFEEQKEQALNNKEKPFEFADLISKLE